MEVNTMSTEPQNDEKETGRLEAFSDGVFAIAITLLILEVRVPHLEEGGQSLWSALGELWPAYLAYVISFLTIAVMWVNHHHLFRYIKRIDNRLLFVNSLLLMSITFVNFSTALLAEYIGKPEQQTAALVYTGTMVVNAILFNVLWRHASANKRLLGKDADMAQVKAITDQYWYGPVVYSIAFVLVFVSVGLSLALQFGLAVFFGLTGSSK
jgi:uncharacterized membrane protein